MKRCPTCDRTFEDESQGFVRLIKDICRMELQFSSRRPQRPRRQGNTNLSAAQMDQCFSRWPAKITVRRILKRLLLRTSSSYVVVVALT